MKTLSLVVFLSGFAATLSITASAQQFRTDVTFKVIADSATKSDIESYIGRELRSLGDVDIVEKDGFEQIYIYVIPLTTASRPLGYALSTTVSFRSTCHFGQTLKPCYVYEDALLLSGPDLRKLCEEAVTEFDRRSLEPMRKK